MITITKYKGRYHIYRNGVLLWQMNKFEYDRSKDALVKRENEEKMKND